MKKGYFRYILLFSGVLIAAGLAGCGGKAPEDPGSASGLSEEELAAKIDGERMVFDYYEATVATVGGDGYDEMVLYEWDGEGLLLAKYSKHEGSEKESVRVCAVPGSVLVSCEKTVDEYGMKGWKEGFGLAGAYYVVKVRDGGTMLRISSDMMPEDGRAAFGAVGSVLKEAWREYGPDGDKGGY